MIEEGRRTELRAGALDDVAFHAAGAQADGEYRCAECGYGVTVWTRLPRCPMCAGESWELPRRRRLGDPAWPGRQAL